MSLLPNLGAHAVFILLSYGAALLIIGGLVLAVMADHRQQKRKLAELEARGITRRSGT